MQTAIRRIFDVPPSTWQELEAMVAQAFDEMGYESHQNHEVMTVRGTVKIDVHAIKKTTPIPTVVLCECKYWNKAVEQNVIYGFRSVCSDIGAHFGLIISKVGFQTGAKETREATNIHLLSFIEFQETFFEEWKTGIFMKFAQMFDASLRLLILNSNYTTLNYADNQALQRKLKNVKIFDKYEVFFGDQRYTSHFIGTGMYPLIITDPRGDPNVIIPITIQSPRQYYEVSVQACADARAYFGI
jgi:hypothetical protein